MLGGLLSVALLLSYMTDTHGDLPRCLFPGFGLGVYVVLPLCRTIKPGFRALEVRGCWRGLLSVTYYFPIKQHTRRPLSLPNSQGSGWTAVDVYLLSHTVTEGLLAAPSPPNGDKAAIASRTKVGQVWYTCLLFTLDRDGSFEVRELDSCLPHPAGLANAVLFRPSYS